MGLLLFHITSFFTLVKIFFNSEIIYATACFKTINLPHALHRLKPAHALQRIDIKKKRGIWQTERVQCVCVFWGCSLTRILAYLHFFFILRLCMYLRLTPFPEQGLHIRTMGRIKKHDPERWTRQRTHGGNVLHYCYLQVHQKESLKPIALTLISHPMGLSSGYRHFVILALALCSMNPLLKFRM